MMPENMYAFNALIFMRCNCSFELSSMMFIMSYNYQSTTGTIGTSIV